ncbi:MAG: hypothetical protein AAGA48_12255 [Myxococcota bacterium]
MAWLLGGALATSSVAWGAPGDHIRVGAIELSPTLDLGSEYRTNVYRSEQDPVPAANVNFAAGLGMAANGEDHRFEARGRWEIQKFFFVGTQQVGVPRPSGQRIGSLDRFDNGSASLAMESFKRNRVGFSIRDALTQRNTTADAEYADLPYTSHLRNDFAFDLRFSPSSALSITPNGTWSYDDFRIPRLEAGGDRSLNQRHIYGPSLDLEWRFLPRTAVVLDADVTWQNWAENALDSNGDDEEIELPNSTFYKVRGGLDGQFTRRLFAQVLLGYGIGVYDGTSQAASLGTSGLDGLLFKFSLRYDLTQAVGDRPGSRLRAGYTKDFNDSFFSNYLALNAFNLEYTGRMGRFEPSARYSIRFEKYNGELARNDVLNRFQLGLATPLGTWARLSVGGWWQQRASSVENVEYDDFHFQVLTSFAY